MGLQVLDTSRGRSSALSGSAIAIPRFGDVIESMSPKERIDAYRQGALTRSERSIWAARFPDEVPLINGELEWIALGVADID